MRTTLFLCLLMVAACTPEVTETETLEGQLTVSAIPRGSTWRYLDTGDDLGTSWRGVHDDSTWDSGAGPLGFGESYLRTTIGGGPITTYFRRSFLVDDPAAIASMVGEVMYDDGFVVYLNGVEVQRDAMPSGTITASTLSSGHEANNAYRAYDWSAFADLLVAGTNTIAVEVHQASASSSDLVFDLSLTFETAPPPGGDDIARGSEWWYWDNGGDQGTAWRTMPGASTGWDLGAGPLGFGEPYIETAVATGRITYYFRRTFVVDDPAVVASIAGELIYDDGAVVYLNGTEIQRVAMPTGAITASTKSTGHEANGYQAFDWSQHAHLLVAGENVLAVEVHQNAASSSDLVFDASMTIELGAPPPTDVGGVDRGSAWWYWDNGGTPSDWNVDPGGATGWDQGDGAFGYGESYLQTTIGYGPSASNKFITSYFRTTFETDNPSEVSSMLAEVMYDDGFVAYLNGVEILRAHMPAGAVSATTLALGHEADNAYVAFDVSAARAALLPGQNVLAVRVHQQAGSSSDLVFDMALRLEAAEPPPPPDEEDVERRSVWAYWDGASAPSTDREWREPEYNDGGWARGAGPLGYGESYLGTTISYGGDAANKPMTAYFRRWFTVDDPTVQTQMILELMYDDGIVVYLNGAEIKRMQMAGEPGEHIGHDTPSTTSHEARNLYEVFDVSAFNGYLVRGANLLAVEVHQQAANSSDLVFDVALQIDTPPVCAIPGGGPGRAPAPGSGFSDVWVAPSTVWAVSGGAVGRRRADGAWCWARPFEDRAWAAIWGTGDDDVWMVGGAGAVAHYDGAAFSLVDAGTTTTLVGVWGSGPDDIWTVGAAGTVRHFDGVAWQAHDLPADKTLTGVWAASPDDVWIAGREFAPDPGGNEVDDGSAGIVYRWQPATATWALEFRNVMFHGGADFSAIDGTSATDIWVVGADHPSGAACAIYTSFHYDGASWTGVGVPECRGLFDVTAGGTGADPWAAGSYEWGVGGAIRHVDGAWDDTVPGPNGFGAIDADGDRVFGAGRDFGDGSTVGPRQYIVRWNGAGFVREW